MCQGLSQDMFLVRVGRRLDGYKLLWGQLFSGYWAGLGSMKGDKHSSRGRTKTSRSHRGLTTCAFITALPLSLQLDWLRTFKTWHHSNVVSFGSQGSSHMYMSQVIAHHLDSMLKRLKYAAADTSSHPKKPKQGQARGSQSLLWHSVLWDFHFIGLIMSKCFGKTNKARPHCDTHLYSILSLLMNSLPLSSVLLPARHNRMSQGSSLWPRSFPNTRCGRRRQPSGSGGVSPASYGPESFGGRQRRLKPRSRPSSTGLWSACPANFLPSHLPRTTMSATNEPAASPLHRQEFGWRKKTRGL